MGRSDWSPDSILASICTEKMGAKTAFQKHIKGLFTWLSHWLSPDESTRPNWNSQFVQGIAPIHIVWDEEEYKEEEVDNLLALKHMPTKKKVLLFELQAALKNHLEETSVKHTNITKRKTDDDIVTVNIPDPLSNLNVDELCFLWALGEIYSNLP